MVEFQVNLDSGMVWNSDNDSGDGSGKMATS